MPGRAVGRAVPAGRRTRRARPARRRAARERAAATTTTAPRRITRCAGAPCGGAPDRRSRQVRRPSGVGSVVGPGCGSIVVAMRVGRPATSAAHGLAMTTAGPGRRPADRPGPGGIGGSARAGSADRVAVRFAAWMARSPPRCAPAGPRWDGTRGRPTSSNGASSLHLIWDAPAGCGHRGRGGARDRRAADGRRPCTSGRSR